MTGRQPKEGLSNTVFLLPPPYFSFVRGGVDDPVITTKAKSLLATDDFLKSFQIGVETYKGTVQLSGFVGSQKAVDKAGEIARSVKGVKTVKNNLSVK